jgi:hypothetical protein
MQDQSERRSLRVFASSRLRSYAPFAVKAIDVAAHMLVKARRGMARRCFVTSTTALGLRWVV